MSAKATSNAIKNLNKWRRHDAGRKFAAKMWANYERVRTAGTRRSDGGSSRIPRDVLNALCWGVGDEHNRHMMGKYKAAAQAAERFCRRGES